jgi:hypothetical protein
MYARPIRVSLLPSGLLAFSSAGRLLPMRFLYSPRLQRQRQLAHPVADRAAAGAEEAGGFGDVAGTVLDGLEDERPLARSLDRRLSLTAAAMMGNRT